METEARVLVVDDEEGIRYTLARFLSDAGFVVDTAADVAETRNLLQRHSYDVAVVDRILGRGENGLELIGYIGVQQPLCRTVLMSAYPTFESAAAALRSGTYDYLTKPVSRDRVCRVVEEAVRKSRAAQEAAAHRDALLRSLLDAAPYAVAVYDRTGHLLRVNDEFADLLCSGKEELVGKRLPYIPGMQWDEMMDRFRELEESNRPSLREKRTVALDGKTLDLEVDLKLNRDGGGTPVGITVVLHNVTEVRRMQKMASLGVLAGGIAHDFKNLLTPIMANAELALSEVQAGTSTHQHLERLLMASDRAGGLVRNILDFARTSKESKKACRMGSVVRDTLHLVRNTAPENIEIRSRIAPGNDAVPLDATQITEFLMNLCANAIHAMRKGGGILEVTLDSVQVEHADARSIPHPAPGPYVRLCVRDTGHGVDRASLDRIFEPFFTTKGREGGTGLGLFMVRSIVEGAGGAVRVSSEPGKGTCFEILLPQRECGEVPEQKIREEESFCGSERILLVDDEEEVADVLRIVLERAGYRVTVYTGAREALERFRADPEGFDLVVTDRHMPGMDGVTLARELSLIRPGLPIIACSGSDDTISPEEMERAGLCAVAAKPLGMELAQIVRRVLCGESREAGEGLRVSAS